MPNFDPQKFKSFLNAMSNTRDSKIRNDHSFEEAVSFDIDFENVDIALRIE